VRIWGRSSGLRAGARDDIAAGPQLVCACGATTPLAAMRGPVGRRRLGCRACHRVLLDQQREATRKLAAVGRATAAPEPPVRHAWVLDGR